MVPVQDVTILVVDDDDGHIELVRRNLRRAGFSNPIQAFQDGQSVLDFLLGRGDSADHPASGPMLMLLDINMPGGMDGIEVLRRIKADPATRLVPVIMLTTADDPRDIDRCYELGCSVYIAKPIDSKAFMEAISRLGLFLSVVCMPSGVTRPR